MTDNTSKKLIDWILEPALSEILNQLIDLVDRQTIDQRQRLPGILLNAKKTPLFFDINQTKEPEYIWDLLSELKALGLIQIKFSKPLKPLDIPYEKSPRIILTQAGEDPLRQALKRPPPDTSYRYKWYDAMMRYNLDSNDKHMQQPIKIGHHSADEIIDRLLKFKTFPPDIYLREASSLAFWGISKVLDNRRELATYIVNNKNAFPEKPILIHIHVPHTHWPMVLFIENETTYHSAIKHPLPGLEENAVLVWVSGFKGSAKRLRTKQGVSFHITLDSDPQAAKQFYSQWIDPEFALPGYFFGDLDFAAMAILKQMRSVFPLLSAWAPGYEKLLDAAKKGNGHAPEEDPRKGEQGDPGHTGCPFADETLLPFLREYGLYLDQEWVSGLSHSTDSYYE